MKTTIKIPVSGTMPERDLFLRNNTGSTSLYRESGDVPTDQAHKLELSVRDFTVTNAGKASISVTFPTLVDKDGEVIKIGQSLHRSDFIFDPKSTLNMRLEQVDAYIGTLSVLRAELASVAIQAV